MENIADLIQRKMEQISTRVDPEDGKVVLRDPAYDEVPELEPDIEELLAARERTLRRIGLRDRELEETFDNFTPYTSSQQAALAACKRVAETPLKELHRGVILFGKTGTGKTHLLAATVQAVADRLVGDMGRWIYSSSLAERIVWYPVLGFLHACRQWRLGEAETAPGERAIRADLLVFDDLGRENATDWALDELMHVIDERYARKKPTLISSNLLKPEALLRRYGDTFASRFLDSECYQVVLVDGPDNRVTRK